MYYGYGFDHMAGWGVFGLMLSVLFWVIIVFVVVALLRRLFWGSRWRGHGMCPNCKWGGGQSALDILQERYAKGEIDKEEYEQRKKVLTE